MRRASALITGALILAGCGTATSEPDRTETVYVTVPPGSTPAPASEAGTPAAPAVEQPEVGVVPDVVGMNHQYAQDTMQAAGFHHLAEEDATGQGRMLLWDRNWEVVEQHPAAGTEAGLDTRILLRSKKIGE